MKGDQKNNKNLLVVSDEDVADKVGEILKKELPNHQFKLIGDEEPYVTGSEIHSAAEKYQFLFKNTSNAIFLVDIDADKYLDANDAALNLTGLKFSELLSQKISENNFKIVGQKRKKLINNSDVSGEIVEYLRPDGSIKIARLNVIHFKKSLYFEIAQEVTDLFDTQLEYEKQGRVYKNLVDNLPGFVYQCKNDRNWTMLFMSNACESITGYKPYEVINNKLLSYNDIIHKDHRQAIWDNMQKTLKRRERFEYRYPIQTRSRQLKWVNERAIGVYDTDGRVLHIEGFITDVTEAVRYEQVQKALINISSSVIHSKDLGSLIFEIKNELGSVIDTTNFYIALYDRKKDIFSLPFFSDEKDHITDLPAGKTMTKFVVDTEKSLLATIATKQKLVKEGKLEFKGTLSKIWLGVPLKVEGEIIGVLAIQSYDDENAYDESDLRILEFVSDQVGLSIQIKRKEEELKDALVMAEEADRLKTSFLANMSHEIRTPMNGILGFTQLLRENDISYEERQHFLSIIEKSGNRMLNIINDLIDVSKVDAGLMDVNITGVDLFEVSNYLYTFFLREVEEKGISLKLEHPSDSESMFIQTDGEKLYAILTNLIKNAIKYSEKGSIIFGYNDLGKDIEFYVKDTGIGIPEHKKKDVFNRFVQLNTSTDPFTEGSGLGLSITKAYVELMGGEIWFNSTENVGTEFYFAIPNKA